MGFLVRGLLVLGGVGVMLLGIVAIATTDPVGGLRWVALGGMFIVVIAIERQRYRSEAAERTNSPAGPGGGERRGEIIEPRFRTTAEVFVDPTTGHRMRVLVDPASGERRYVAEE